MDDEIASIREKLIEKAKENEKLSVEVKHLKKMLPKPEPK
jgi:regulator of replication initiation timing